MNGAGRSRVIGSLDWLEARWDKLQLLGLGVSWLRGLIVTPMSPLMAVIFTMGCLVLAVTFRQIINPFLDNAADELVSWVIHIIRLGHYYAWPILLETLPPLLHLLAETAPTWPPVWNQTTFALKIYGRVCFVRVKPQIHAIQLWQKTKQNRTRVGSRYSIAKVPYRLYPVSCILLE